MNTHTALKVLAVVLLLGLGYFLFIGRGGDSGANGARAARSEAARPVEVEPPADLSAVDEVESSEAAVAERVEAIGSPVRATSVPFAGELAGLVGRVVEADGTPVAGIRVALLELDTEILFSGGLLDSVSKGAKPPSLEVEDTVTDVEGRFLLGGARAPAFHGLGVDLGGPRATLRVLDSALAHRERTDVGDVVLAPFGVVTGRIVDDSGAGVSGARVRLGSFVEELLLGAPYELRADSLVGISMYVTSGKNRGVVELPSWVHALVDKLPIPTTYSDETGAFRLAGVPLDEILGGVDKPGYAGIPVGPIDMSARAEEHDLGELVLSRGRTVEGYVEDSEGDPVVGAEVYAGAEVPAGFVAILQPCGTTDEDGEFSLSGVRAEGQVIAVTRRSKSEPWTGVVTTMHDDVFLSLESLIELTVLVQDEAHEPLPGAHIALQPKNESDALGLGEILRFLPPETRPHRGFREAEPGRYVTQVTPGAYDVTVLVEGRALGAASADLWDEESEVVVTIPAGRHVAVTVVDAATREAIHGARASIMAASDQGFARLATKTTGAGGKARLGPFGNQDATGMRGETILVVRHPRYADHSDVLMPGVPEAVVELEAGGVLAGHVHWGGKIPERRYMLAIEYREAKDFLEVFNMPRLALTDAEGAFRIEALPEGEYHIEVLERFLDRDPLGMMNEEFEPITVHSEKLAIVNGQTTELVVDLTPTGRGPTARVRGRVRVNGQEIEGAEVKISGRGSSVTETDTWGRFESEDIPVSSEVSVTIWGDVPTPAGETQHMLLYAESFEVRAGEVREIDVDLVPVEVIVEVVDGRTGEPIAEAVLDADKYADEVPTDAMGRATLWIMEAGEHFDLAARADGFARGHVRVEKDQTEVRLELFPSVPCAGRVAVGAAPSAAGTLGSFSYVAVRSEDGKHGNGVVITGPEYAFELEDLPAGTYRVWMVVDGVQGQETSLELGPHGDTNLVIDFVPREE